MSLVPTVVLDQVTVTEALGITGWDNNEGAKHFIAAENRIPLLNPYNNHGNTQTILALIFGPLGAGWTSENNTFSVIADFEGDFKNRFEKFWSH